MRKLRLALLTLLIVLLLVAGGFTVWAYTPLGPMPEAVAALPSDVQAQVQTSPWLTFRPAAGQPTTGFIIYPGGRVDARSYAPTARAIAEQGYLAVIVPMPFNLAVFAPGKAGEVIAAHPEIRHWAIGGHSLGGAMAANYVYSQPEAVQGLVLWAAYPAANNNLADRQVAVVSVSGTQDGLSTRSKIDASRVLLPSSTRWVVIQGGNHAGFGWYGAQPGDGQAQISREEQQKQIIAATLDLLASLGKP